MKAEAGARSQGRINHQSATTKDANAPNRTVLYDCRWCIFLIEFNVESGKWGLGVAGVLRRLGRGQNKTELSKH